MSGRNGTPVPIVIARNYDELRAALEDRVLQLNTTFEAVDAVAFDGAMGRPMRYTQKLLGQVPVKSLGRISLGPLLGALGLMLIVAEDTEQLGKIRHRLTKRVLSRSDAGRRMLAAKRRRKSKFPKGPEHARLMRNRQILTQSPAKRRAIAKKAARARWRRPRRQDASAETPSLRLWG